MARGYCADLPDFEAQRAGFLNGTTTPSALLDLCLANIDQSEAAVRAFTHLDLDGARAAARQADARYRAGTPLSPIDGLPIAVKDIIDTKDMPTACNSPFYSGHQPRIDAACVAAARAGGAVILGKTVTTEFALGLSGPTTNPHDTTRTPGGSSSGSAAGAAAGMFCAAFATQTLGSILRPAAYNGVVGFKPTHGALSLAGVHPISHSHDHLGAVGQNVDTVWRLVQWMAQTAPGLDASGLGLGAPAPVEAIRPRRLAIARPSALQQMDTKSHAAFETCMQWLRDQGVDLVEADQDPALADLVARLNIIPDLSGQMVAFEMRWPYAGYIDVAPDLISPVLHDWVARGAKVSLAAYQAMLAERAELRRRVARLGQVYDGVILPVAPGPAPVGLASTGARELQTYWSFLGFPAFSLPMMAVDHMPFGLQLAGFAGGDHRLARHAKWLMQTHQGI